MNVDIPSLGISRAFSLGALLVGGGTLLEYAAGLDLRIDQLLAADRVQRPNPGRMAPATEQFAKPGPFFGQNTPVDEGRPMGSIEARGDT